MVLKGDTNISYLKENGVRIWNEWADEKVIWVQFTGFNGEIGIMMELTKSKV